MWARPSSALGLERGGYGRAPNRAPRTPSDQTDRVDEACDVSPMTFQVHAQCPWTPSQSGSEQKHRPNRYCWRRSRADIATLGAPNHSWLDTAVAKELLELLLKAIAKFNNGLPRQVRCPRRSQRGHYLRKPCLTSLSCRHWGSSFGLRDCLLILNPNRCSVVVQQIS